MSETSNPFGITREEILNLAAQKLADDATGDSLWDIAKAEVTRRIDEHFKSVLLAKIDTALAAEMERVLSTTIAPVNIWGEKIGQPTTLRDALAEKAKDYWNELVNNEGNPSDRWGSKLTRAEWLMRKITAEEFSHAIKQNLTNIVGAFKDSLRDQAQKDIGDHLNKILAVKTARD